MAERNRETADDPDIIGLSELFEPSMMNMDLQAEDRWEAIETLVDQIVQAGAISAEDRDNIVAGIFGREGRSRGAMKNAVAMPAVPIDRALTDGKVSPPRMLVSVGRCKAGIDFQSRDRVPVKIIFVVLIPRSRFKQVLEAMHEQDFLYEEGTLVTDLINAESMDAFIERMEVAESRIHHMGF